MWQDLIQAFDGEVHNLIRVRLMNMDKHSRLFAVLVLLSGACLQAANAAETVSGTWSDRFLNPLFGNDTFNATASVVAVAGDQTYVGGNFTRIGSVAAGAGSLAANGIARWDGQRWLAMGDGLGGFVNTILDGSVNAIVADGQDVYVGGTFTTAGGQPASRIARWDGSRWWPLGDGLNGPVHSIFVQDGQVYAGGGFSGAGGVTLNGVGRWNGSSWSALGTGLAANFKVRAMAAYNGRIFAAGSFFVIQPGGTLIRALAQWDGERWSAVGTGVNGDVNALAVYGGRLVAGGQFTTAGGAPANRLAAWDGAAWSALGAGVGGGVLPAVNSLAVQGDALIAGGTFTTAGDGTANGLAAWNGSSWSTHGQPLVTAIATPGTVAGLATAPDGLVTVGNFSDAGGMTVPGLARWDGSRWRAFGEGIGGSVQAMTTTPDGTYVGGQFATAGGLKVNSIARRRNGEWSALGGGVLASGQPGLIRALVARGSNVYAGGAFSVAGGIPATNVARWNGTSWEALGGGLSGGAGAVVISLALAPNGDLVAGGVFTQAGGQPARNIARWNGTGWSALGDGLFGTGGGAVQALAFLDDDLVAGGAFNQPVPFLARWNGGGWSSIGEAPNATVLALGVHGGALYAGGYFTRIGGGNVRRIGRWDGAGWAALGSGLGNDTAQDYVAVLNASDAGVFAAGVFTNAGEVAVRRIARFADGEWTALGSGITTGPLGGDPFVYGLGVEGGVLSVGGAFSEAGGIPASAFSTWSFEAAPAAPSLSISTGGTGELVLVWSATAGTRFQLVTSATLDGAFTPLGEPLTATGGAQQITLAAPATQARWYRLVAAP